MAYNDYRTTSHWDLESLLEGCRLDEHGHESMDWENIPVAFSIRSAIDSLKPKILHFVQALQTLSCVYMDDDNDWDHIKKINLKDAVSLNPSYQLQFHLEHVNELAPADISDPRQLPLPGGCLQEELALTSLLHFNGDNIREFEMVRLDLAPRLASIFYSYGFKWIRAVIEDDGTPILKITKHLGTFDSRNPYAPYGWSLWYDE